MIQVLSNETIDKIAAGEVVEKPCSVVKELCENAIDAKADFISVEIKEGGISLIRVTDNGEGIEKDEIPKAFLRHATSKITCIEDLENAMSLGFRGEALSSIAAVSQVELITKRRKDLAGTRFTIEGGSVGVLSDVGAPDGTTFIVRNLFFNTPVRKKFLKTPSTEGSYIAQLMEHLALSHPDVSFQFISGGQTKLQTSGKGDLKEVIYRIYGRDLTKELISVDFEDNGMRLTGYIAKPIITRNNRSFEVFFVNGRHITSNVLQKATEEAYRSFLMQHKFPFVVLHLEAMGKDVDANVHPQKAEVRFSDPVKVYNFIQNAISSALRNSEMIPEVSFDAPKVHFEKPVFQEPPRETVSANDKIDPDIQRVISHSDTDRESEPLRVSDLAKRTKTVQRPALPFESKRLEEERPVYETESRGYKELEQLSLFGEKMLTREAVDEYHIIGQVFDTYWIVQYQDQMLLIDQHAAHEKVLFERFSKQINEGGIVSQQLMPPIILSLTMREESVLNQHMDDFASLGFEIEHFGGREYALRAMPDLFSDISSKDMLIEILDELEESDHRTNGELLYNRIATKACKAAVKGNNSISQREAKALIEELVTLDNPYHCPHGRPTIITMTKSELEKKFKRIL